MKGGRGQMGDGARRPAQDEIGLLAQILGTRRPGDSASYTHPSPWFHSVSSIGTGRASPAPWHLSLDS